MKKILFTWLGMTDLRGSQGELPDSGLGPIGQAVEKFEFTEIHILSDLDKSANTAYSKWLETLIKNTHKGKSSKGLPLAKIAIHPWKLSSPMNFSEIYEAVESTLEEVFHNSPVCDNEKAITVEKNVSGTVTLNRKNKLVYHISPGTSAMAAIWIILAKSAYPAELIQSSVEEGAKIISIPFDIAADYSPALMLGHDEEILRITQGLPAIAPEFDKIIHKCSLMEKVITRSRIVGMHDIPVLITGESGTGKELFARAIHGSSLRKDKPFIEVNCGAIPESLFESEFFGHEKGAFTGASRDREGYIESANGGTLFLDEIGELPLYAQVKLLRVIQERKVIRVGASHAKAVDIRIISATNRDIMEEVSSGNFREDLFHRIAIGVLHLPPLHERKGDLNLLIDFFIEEINCEFRKIRKENWAERRLSANARNALLAHKWPGNIRELRNTLSRLILWSTNKVINSKEIKDAIFSIPNKKNREPSIFNSALLEKPDFNLENFLGDVALKYIDEAIEKCEGNKSKASEILGFTNYQTLNNWVKKYR